MFNKDITITRTYKGRKIDFAILGELLKRFEQSLPPESKKDDRYKLKVVPRFEISSFSQQVAIESLEQFTAFLSESEEPPEKVKVWLDCHRVPGSGIAPYSISPPYIEIIWSLTKITVQISRSQSRTGLAYLKGFERDLHLEAIKPEAMGAATPSFASFFRPFHGRAELPPHRRRMHLLR